MPIQIDPYLLPYPHSFVSLFLEKASRPICAALIFFGYVALHCIVANLAATTVLEKTPPLPAANNCHSLHRLACFYSPFYAGIWLDVGMEKIFTHYHNCCQFICELSVVSICFLYKLIHCFSLLHSFYIFLCTDRSAMPTLSRWRMCSATCLTPSKSCHRGEPAPWPHVPQEFPEHRCRSWSTSHWHCPLSHSPPALQPFNIVLI